MTDVYTTMLSRMFHCFRNSPNILKRHAIAATSFQDTNDAIDYFRGHWGIDNAEGELLNKVGQLLGVYRPLAQEDPSNIFTLFSAGETCDEDNSQGFSSESDPLEGGYFTSENGLVSQTDPGANATDAYYKFLIRQKAASYRKKATVENLFLYLIAFGGRCIIDDDESFVVEYDPLDYDDMDNWTKNYVITRGFKPAGIKIKFREMMRDGDSI